MTDKIECHDIPHKECNNRYGCSGCRADAAAVSPLDDLVVLPKASFENARKAYIELTNSVEFADNGEASYVAGVEIMDQLDKLFE